MSVAPPRFEPEPLSGASAARPLARDVTLIALQRQLGVLLPNGAADETDGAARPLELTATNLEPPRLVSAAVVEGTTMRAHRIDGAPEARFSAFLDGTQSSQIIRHVSGVPLIRGTVAAVVRLRRNRRMTTWRQVVATRIYAPLRLVSQECRGALRQLPVDVADTAAGADGAEVIEHPYALRDAAIHLVQRHRERLEQDLAKQWCGVVGEPLFIDGGISANERLPNDDCIAGVVKSHRTLYAEGDGLRVVLGLRVGQRSSVFRITSPRRNAVASWYLRLHDPAGRDPMWGLVRVEIPEPSASGVGVRADEISRWILAEVSPIALPDARWDKMVYGIRDCEEFLRAVI